MNESRKLIYLSYDQIAMKMDAMMEEIRTEMFDAIVSIVRGGNFPATHLSYRTGLPIYYLQYDRRANPATVEWMGAVPSRGQKVLLVEDLAGAGQTLIQSRRFIEEAGLDVRSFVIFKDAMSASTPEYIAFETNVPSETFIVPWEKTKYNPAYYTRDKSKPFVDHEFEFAIWDLDVVTRDVQVKMGAEDVILTDRTSEYYMEVAGELQDRGIKALLYMREESLEEDHPSTTASWLGKKAVEIGGSRLILASAEQAIILASQYPQLEVWWWNNGAPIAIKGSAVAVPNERLLLA